jgi:hypothetical protein
MTGAERQRRHIAKLRARAARPDPIPVPAPKAAPVALEGRIIRLAHLEMAPVQVAQWLARELDPDKARAFCDALDQALKDLG